ncbi:MAG: RNA polymerase sigma factor [Chloroflexota bacterium]|nr:MAG: RNA polymerase sigma factor [Chloroflexota bacterium]
MEPEAILTEAELVERAVAGDCAAFGEIYTRYLDAIYRYVFYRVHDGNDAEDLTETVFLKAWLGISEYRDMGLRFSCWLYRIAHNTVIDFHRRQMADPCIEKAWFPGDEIETSRLLRPLTELEDASALNQAISKLTEDEQQIILLRFVEGFSHAEVAAIMDRTEGACRMLQTRALVALQRKLNGT